MENREKVLKALRILRFLIRKEREWAGYICLEKGLIVELIEGKGDEVDLSMTGEGVRAKGMQGLGVFHTHPERFSNGPSNGDCFLANISGVVNYLIDINGIWEIKPEAMVPLEVIYQAWQEVFVHYPDFMYWRHASNSNWTKFWEELRSKLPVDVSLIYPWPES